MNRRERVKAHKNINRMEIHMIIISLKVKIMILMGITMKMIIIENLPRISKRKYLLIFNG
jgi:hypothetical protein